MSKEIKRTCFAFNENKYECNALKHLYCGIKKEPDCNFYIHKDDIDIRGMEKDIRNYSPNEPKKEEEA